MRGGARAPAMGDDRAGRRGGLANAAFKFQILKNPAPCPPRATAPWGRRARGEIVPAASGQRVVSRLVLPLVPCLIAPVVNPGNARATLSSRSRFRRKSEARLIQEGDGAADEGNRTAIRDPLHLSRLSTVAQSSTPHSPVFESIAAAKNRRARAPHHSARDRWPGRHPKNRGLLSIRARAGDRVRRKLGGGMTEICQPANLQIPVSYRFVRSSEKKKNVFLISVSPVGDALNHNPRPKSAI